MDYQALLARLQAQADPENAAGMARFGIKAPNVLGIPMPALRRLAKEIGKDHVLAVHLWSSGIHEARILAALIDAPQEVTEAQMERWVREFDAWDICDQCCLNLFDKTPWAYAKAMEWGAREEEFVKRAGFALMAVLAVHDKQADDARFLPFLALIKREAGDGRNFVKKAVNWALRQIGKRSRALHEAAVAAAREIGSSEARAARWIAADALRELTSAKITVRLKND